MVKLNTSVLVGSLIYPAGSDLPNDLVDQVDSDDVFAGGRPSTHASYGDLKVDELKQLIAGRNEGREEADLISDEGKKADLVAVLEADDATSGDE